MTRQTALALDRFDHGAFLSADIGARAAPQIDVSRCDQPCLFERTNFAPQNFQHRGIFIPHIEKDGIRLDRPCGDQHPFEEKMRLSFQIPAVLEGPRLALVPVDGKIARARVVAHEAPFLARGESGPAKTTQAGIEHLLLNGLPVARGAQLRQGLIAAVRAVGIEGFIIGNHGVEIALGDDGFDLFGCRVIDVAMADLQHRGGVAAAHAGRAHHPDFRGIAAFFQRGFERLRARQFTGQRITDPDRQVGRGRFALLHHIEMGIEGRDLVDLCHAQAHFLGQSTQMRCGKMAIFILDEVQILNQQIAPARAVAQQRAHLFPWSVLKLTALGVMASLPLAGFPNALARFRSG